MSDKLNPMGLFLDKFKEVNYVKFADSDYVTSQLNNTDIETVVFSAVTQTLIEDDGAQLRRSTSVNTPGWYGSCIGVARLGGRNK